MNQRFLPLLTTISLFAVACSTNKASYREAAPPSPAVQATADGKITTATGGEAEESRPQSPTFDGDIRNRIAPAASTNSAAAVMVMAFMLSWDGARFCVPGPSDGDAESPSPGDGVSA